MSDKQDYALVDADSSAAGIYFGASIVILAAIVVPGLVAMFLTDDFWLIVATMGVGAFVGVVLESRTGRPSRS